MKARCAGTEEMHGELERLQNERTNLMFDEYVGWMSSRNSWQELVFLNSSVTSCQERRRRR